LNPVKLEDIARSLNLSVSTVSRALSGNGRVGEKTRRRVQEAVRESGYTVNTVARSLRIRDARNIGVVVPDIGNSYFASIIKGAQQFCRENGYTLTVCSSDEDADYEAEALQMLLEKQVSGVILASVGGSRDYVRHYARLGIPIVFIDNIPENCGAHDLVTIDNLAAAYSLTEAMIARGYRELGAITGPRSQATGQLRYEGFVKAMTDAGLEIKPEWVLEGEFRAESGYQLMKDLLALPDRPRAMIFGNNNLSCGAINAIREAGLNIPGDVALATFDIEDPTGLITPHITTLNQPAREIGGRAAEIIFARLNDGVPEENRIIYLEPVFVEGESW